MFQVDAQISSEQLLKAIKQMRPHELDAFIGEVLKVRHHRGSDTTITAEESELLLRINRPIPDELLRRTYELIAKRRSKSLTENEHHELTQLEDQIENLDAQRIADLAALAALRKTTLPALMDSLGIPAPTYD